MSTEAQVQQLISVTGRLSRLVKEENDILGTNGRPQGLKALFDQKSALSTVYEQQINTRRRTATGAGRPQPAPESQRCLGRV